MKNIRGQALRLPACFHNIAYALTYIGKTPENHRPALKQGASLADGRGFAHEIYDIFVNFQKRG